jgi:hypothetical protein
MGTSWVRGTATITPGQTDIVFGNYIFDDGNKLNEATKANMKYYSGIIYNCVVDTSKSKVVTDIAFVAPLGILGSILIIDIKYEAPLINEPLVEKEDFYRTITYTYLINNTKVVVKYYVTLDIDVNSIPNEVYRDFITLVTFYMKVEVMVSYSKITGSFVSTSVILRVKSGVGGEGPTFLQPLPPLPPPSDPSSPELRIIWISDRLGANLGEIICFVEGNYLQQDQYPKKLIGKYSWFHLFPNVYSYFSKYPNLMGVMKGKPTRTYFEKAQELNDTSLTDTPFYLNLLSFMALRYFLGGLTSGCLTRKWLLQRNTQEFYSNLLNSEFAVYITLFTVQYKGYNLYMDK